MAERNLSIDLIKVIAMFSVIALHAFGALMEWRVANIFYESAVVAVPLFFMVSGYLMIHKDVDRQYLTKKIYNILRLVGVLSLIVLLFEVVTYGNISVHYFLKVFLGAFVQKGPLWMCWYLGAMIILFCFLPLINKIRNRKTYWQIIALFGIIEIGVFSINLFPINRFSEIMIPQTFRIWTWLFYFMLGGGLKMLPVIRNKDYLGSFIIVMMILNVVIQEQLKQLVNSPFCEYFYCSPHVMAYALGIFLFIKNKKLTNQYVCRIVKFISPLFLSVYLFHPFIVNIIYSKLPLSQTLLPYACFVFTSVITVGLCHLMNKVSFFNRLLKI